MPNTDISGRAIRVRDIVLVTTSSYGMQFGVIEELSDPIRVIMVFKEGHEQIEEITDSESQILLVAHRQIPESIRSRLIEISDFRIKGPGDLSRNRKDGSHLP